MKITFFLLIATLLFNPELLCAQHLDANQLILDSKYSEAVVLLQQQIKKARQHHQPTTLFEVALQRARVGLNMAANADTIQFVDTLVVDRTNFFQALKLSQQKGTLQPAKRLFPQYETRIGASAYVNGWGDIAYFSLADSSGVHNLYRALKINGQWSTPQLLPGLYTIDADRDYPFMSTDGITLYFSEQSAQSVGGFDLFVTRYDFDSHQFLKPEQLRLPLNSSYNDLLYVPGEKGTMLLVTDRKQPIDKVQILTLKKHN